MTDGPHPVHAPPPVHPRYPDLTAKDWADAEAQVALFVHRKVGTALGDPRDIASEAVRRAYEPTAPLWDRKKPLARYLGSFANSLMANGVRKLEFRSTRGLLDDDLVYAPAEEDNPEEALLRAEENAGAERLFEEFCERIDHDRCCVILIQAYRDAAPNASELAIAAGFTSGQITDARKKIARAVSRVVRDRARASRGKG